MSLIIYGKLSHPGPLHRLCPAGARAYGALAGGRTRAERNDDLGEAVWGIEWRIAPYGVGRVLNLCNYRGEPLTVRIVGADGRPVAGLRDVLTGARLNGSLILKPLEVRLLAGSW